MIARPLFTIFVAMRANSCGLGGRSLVPAEQLPWCVDEEVVRGRAPEATRDVVTEGLPPLAQVGQFPLLAVLVGDDSGHLDPHTDHLLNVCHLVSFLDWRRLPRFL